MLLYTSGSTGVPKGCQLTHGNLVNYCNWYWKYYDLKPEHNVAEYASYGFDVHQEGIYPPLTAGATVHIIPEELRLDLVSLNEYLEREHITHTFMTTQVGYQFATNIDNHSLMHMSVAGEKLASIAPPQGYQLHNGYGPTEATILITIYPVTKKDKDVPIGKPLDNVRLYVVDQQGHRLPVELLTNYDCHIIRPLMAYNLGGNRKVRSIESTNDYTTQVLYRLGFQWPVTAADYVHRFVDTIVGFDYFNV